MGIDKLYHTLFQPQDQKVKATILILHGMMEHSGRYTAFAKYLSEQGFAVLTYDHLGHGRTAKSTDELGFFQLENPAQQLVNDAESMADYLEKLYPDVPHFVLGHLMGSFIARCLLQQAGSHFDGAIISGTGGRISGISLAYGYLALLNRIAPRQRSQFINKTFSWMNNRHFKHEKDFDGTNWLSVNKENRIAFTQDPLCGIDFSNNGFYTLLSLYIRATRKGWTKTIAKSLPVLLVSGSDDPIGDFGKGTNQAAKDLQQDGFGDVTVNLYPKMRHEILNEDIKEQVYREIEQWIISHI